MPRPSREAVMTALFNKLVASVVVPFTAGTQANSTVLQNPSTIVGMFVGLPVFGDGVPEGAVIAQLAPLTLSLPATANAASVAMKTGFLTTGRRVIMWDKVKAQPALFLRDADEHLYYGETTLQRQTMRAEVYIYSRAGTNPEIAPATGLNNLLDAVQAAFAPDDPMRYRFTLGGLVEWCRLDGKVEKYPGDLDGQAIAVAEVEITVP